jgi:AcrR family transcriptional regulator
MSRWEPNARGRLEQAAYELFRDRGYDQTTVADIAERAGLTQRTFFRHYSDKREVLFGGARMLQEELEQAIARVPPDLTPIEAVRIAIAALGTAMGERRSLAHERRQIIDAHGDLQERELIKRSALTAALAQALQARGVPEPSASLAADIGIAVFYVSFTQWLEENEQRNFPDIIHENFTQLKTLSS